MSDEQPTESFRCRHCRQPFEAVRTPDHYPLWCTPECAAAHEESKAKLQAFLDNPPKAVARARKYISQLGKRRLTSNGLSANPEEWNDFPPAGKTPPQDAASPAYRASAVAMGNGALDCIRMCQTHITVAIGLLDAGHPREARAILDGLVTAMDSLPTPILPGNKS